MSYEAYQEDGQYLLFKGDMKMKKGIFDGAETKLKRLTEHESRIHQARGQLLVDLEIMDKALADILEKKEALKEQIG